MKTIRHYTADEIIDLITQALETRRRGSRPVKVLSVKLKISNVDNPDDPTSDKVDAEVEVGDDE